MSFSEKLKTEVKRKAAFRCCRCQQIGVQVHQIIPEENGGHDTIDNAAPLCAGCHYDFGGNPDKRKEIRQMRDWWYKKTEQIFSKSDERLIGIEQQLDEKIAQLTEKHEQQIVEIKNLLQTYFNEYVDKITPENVQRIATSVVNIIKPPFIAGSPCQMSGQPCPSSSCDGIMDVDKNGEGVVCSKCGLHIGPP